MRKYVRKTEHIDKERGDKLTTQRQDLAALYAPNCPTETRRDILDAFIGWFCGKEESTLDNPLANAFLQTLIDKQKANVQRYLDICEDRRPKKKMDKDGETYVDISSVGATHAPINKSKVKEESKIDSSFTGGDEESRADAAPPSPLTVADAKKELMVLAPPITSHNYSKDNIDYYNETKDDDWASADAAIEHTLVVVDEPDNNTTRITLTKLCAKIGLSLFARAVFHFDTEIFNAEHGGDGDGKCPFRSKGKTLIARLKRLAAAVAVLNEAKISDPDEESPE